MSLDQYFSISSWVYLVLTACVKLTFLFFYRRLFSAHTKGKYFIDGAIVFIMLLNTALLIATILSCLPIQRSWNSAVPGHCINPVILPYFSGISSSATDIYVLILPLVFLWGLNMTIQRKIRVAAVFCLGILSVASSLVRLAETPSLRTNPDATWALSNIIIWAALEVNIGIICSCFVTLPAFFERHIPLSTRSLLSHLFSSSPSSKEINSANPPTEASDSQWSKYKHLDDSDSQNLVRHHPENNILQANTFSVGELRGHGTPNAGNFVPWAGHTGDDQAHSTHVQAGSNNIA